jgi:hypothetical protein
MDSPTPLSAMVLQPNPYFVISNKCQILRIFTFEISEGINMEILVNDRRKRNNNPRPDHRKPTMIRNEDNRNSRKKQKSVVNPDRDVKPQYLGSWSTKCETH